MSSDKAIAAANALLPGEPAPEDEIDPRWQAIIEVGNYIPTEPLRVWAFVKQWGSHDQDDLRAALATCLVEHLLEHHFDLLLPLFEAHVEQDPEFVPTLKLAWKFGQATLPENARRLDTLLVRLS